eukprot:CAMPEP_0117589334 /NCGR_PEP_ID=MMETSP0784-20121206/70356_1 /TAXON_ID=39447 /ORGANISM="" /LENGTH=88 /DNA_ID=CAMNT_0005390807 /DNA_START=268 /DNA_END=531 /DNA_ORIENTATION=+
MFSPESRAPPGNTQQRGKVRMFGVRRVRSTFPLPSLTTATTLTLGPGNLRGKTTSRRRSSATGHATEVPQSSTVPESEGAARPNGILT